MKKHLFLFIFFTTTFVFVIGNKFVTLLMSAPSNPPSVVRTPNYHERTIASEESCLEITKKLVVKKAGSETSHP